MIRRPDPEPEDEEPVLRTPPGAAPRNLRTAKFETFGVQAKASFTPPPDRAPANVEPLPRLQGPPEPLEWDFALPAGRALEPAASPLLEPDANRRNTSVQNRGPQEDIVPSEAKEKFNDNWQRLASQPPARRRLAKPPSRPWYRTAEGRLNVQAIITPGIVIVLAIVTLVVARKVLAPPAPPAPHPAATGK